MVNTSNKAELQNCITNAQEIIRQIESRANRLGELAEKEELHKLTGQADILLKEANERCNNLF